MTIQEIITHVKGRIVVGAHHENDEIEFAFASDLMSDVLTITSSHSHKLMLITGLCNVQTIRTAEMSDIKVILFVRNKKVTDEMIELAEENEMVLIETSLSMFRTSGILFNLGIQPLY